MSDDFTSVLGAINDTGLDSDYLTFKELAEKSDCSEKEVSALCKKLDASYGKIIITMSGKNYVDMLKLREVLAERETIRTFAVSDIPSFLFDIKKELKEIREILKQF